MSPETTQSDSMPDDSAPDDGILPPIDMQDSQDDLADWARQVNEREQTARQLEDASGVRASSHRRGFTLHFGRHRPDH